MAEQTEAEADVGVHGSRTPTFEIKSVIEQKPFESPPVRSFFKQWFRANDSISPQVVDRQIWEQKAATEGILENAPDKKKTLFLPKDLRLEEMVSVFKAIDHDTFADKPERQNEASEKVKELMSFLRDTGVYFYSRLDSIQSINQKFYTSQVSDTDPEREEKREEAVRKAHGTQGIARALSEELYKYGIKFGDGSDPALTEAHLSPERTMCLDIFVTTGEILSDAEGAEFLSFLSNPSFLQDTEKAQRYRTIRMMLPKKNILIYASQKGIFDADTVDEIEAYRSEKIAQFFRVSEKAFAFEQRSIGGERSSPQDKLKPWQRDTPIHRAFLDKIERAMAREIEVPKREFVNAIFRRGMEKLVNEMRETSEIKEMREMKEPRWKRAVYSFFEEIGVNLPLEQKKLADFLHITQMRADLEAIRQSGDLVKISATEREIADKIQQAVSKFPYKSLVSNPAEMVANQNMACVGFSELGGALMKEAGLRYLVGNLPEHSILFLVTSDDHVEYRDMQTVIYNEDLIDEAIDGVKQDGSQLTVKDIADFSYNPNPQGLSFNIVTKDRLSDGQRLHITLFESEYGLQLQVLNNTGNALRRLGQNEEAIEAYRQATENGKQLIFVNEFGPVTGSPFDLYTGKSGVAIITVSLNKLPSPSSIITIPTDSTTQWGNAVASDSIYNYIYGTDSNTSTGAFYGMKLARVAIGHTTQINNWQYWNGSTWVSGESKAALLNTGNELTGITKQLSGTGYIGVSIPGSVYTDKTLDVSYACSPQGPWSTPTAIYTIPEIQEYNNEIAYIPTFHPELSKTLTGLLVSYNVNTTDGINAVAQDVHEYQPRFLLVK